MRTDQHFCYGGLRLGARYCRERTEFRVFSQAQSAPELELFDRFGESASRIPMQRDGECFAVTVPGDLAGRRYRFRVGEASVTDPYSVTCTLNSRHSVVTDLSQTDPPGFRASAFSSTPPEQAVICELHIGDFTYDRSAQNPFGGKFLALTQTGTRCAGEPTGLDHLKAMGITHVHLMPVNDFLTVDESLRRFGADDNYNWGYDPELYNVPEGSYSIDPDSPNSRITELKAMIQSLHDAGIGVIIDVVYNHTYRDRSSNLNLLAPDYYYRMRDGRRTNGSGVGNELDTEKPLVRKLIIDSLLYWQSEYRIDGFRFDLMALIDRETVGLATKALMAVNPNTLIYGEPWTGGASGLPDERKTLWGTQRCGGFSLFNEYFRQALRGDNDGGEWGYIQGDSHRKQAVIRGLLGSADTAMPPGECLHPVETVNYFNAHDNLILEDKLRLAFDDPGVLTARTRLAFGLLLTAQGIPLFHAGNAFRRDKRGNANAYNAPFGTNAIDWRKLSAHRELADSVAELIALRKRYGLFCLDDARTVRARVQVMDTESDEVIALRYKRRTKGFLLIVHNIAYTDRQLRWDDDGGRSRPVQVRCVYGAPERDETADWAAKGGPRIPPISTMIYEVEVEDNGL